jgi:hypothetical protein
MRLVTGVYQETFYNLSVKVVTYLPIANLSAQSDHLKYLISLNDPEQLHYYFYGL